MDYIGIQYGLYCNTVRTIMKYGIDYNGIQCGLYWNMVWTTGKLEYTGIKYGRY